MGRKRHNDFPDNDSSPEVQFPTHLLKSDSENSLSDATVQTDGCPDDTYINPCLRVITETSDVLYELITKTPKLCLHVPSRPSGSQTEQLRSNFASTANKISVTKLEEHNYYVICDFSTSTGQGDAAVDLQYVRCTFWCLGDSLKPGGCVSPVVVSAYCYTLHLKPSGHPKVSRRHYFFTQLADNLLEHIDDADEDVLQRAFRRHTRAFPLHLSDTLFFPTCFDGHWFVFAVDIKHKKYVILDSYYKEHDIFQQTVRDIMRNSFEHHWNKYIQIEMGFGDYDFFYPVVPEQPIDNNTDSGIYAMMFMAHWTSPTDPLTSVFRPQHIPNIRIKIANELVFQPANTGKKNHITDIKISG